LSWLLSFAARKKLRVAVALKLFPHNVPIQSRVAQRAEQVAAASDEVKQALADGKDLLRHATEIKVRAERRCGEMLRDMQKSTGGDAQRTRFQKGTESPPTLADMGIEKHQSSRWQKLAAVPETQFEQAVAPVLARR